MVRVIKYSIETLEGKVKGAFQRIEIERQQVGSERKIITKLEN